MVSRTAPTAEFENGQNRLECRTCPFQFPIVRTYYEKKYMKRKEVEDVLGEDGLGGDKTDGGFLEFVLLYERAGVDCVCRWLERIGCGEN